jgi:hypothetical protein
MRQALCIFRKDVNYLRIEIAVFVLVAAAFARVNLPSIELLISLAAAYVIVRAVHADGIPGDRQFWLTRPYNRWSLLAAKLLFVVVCISLPLALAELTVALRAGFSLSEIIPPLLLSQALVFVFGALPVMALAALTSGIVSFIVIALALTLLSMSGATASEFWLSSHSKALPDPVERIGTTLFAMPVAAATLNVLYWQYKSRVTNSSRILAIAGLNVAVLLFLFVPVSFALKTQSWLSKKPDLASGITITPGRGTRGFATSVYFADRKETKAVPLTLIVNHPPNTEVRADDMTATASWEDGPVTFMRQPSINRRYEEDRQATFDVNMMVDPRQYRARRNKALTIRGSVWLTLFGDEEKIRISARTRAGGSTRDGLHCQITRVTDRGVSVPPPPGGQPEWHPSDFVTCAALFQWPRELVYAEAGEYQSDFRNTLISYAPFLIGLPLSPLEVRPSDPIGSDDVTIVTRKPLAHFRRDFVLTGVKFADFEPTFFLHAPPSPPRPPGR